VTAVTVISLAGCRHLLVIAVILLVVQVAVLRTAKLLALVVLVAVERVAALLVQQRVLRTLVVVVVGLAVTV
jgi:hypothetical protein